MNPQAFAQKIKQKYPQYAAIDDLALADKVLEKYPQYRTQVNAPSNLTSGNQFADISLGASDIEGTTPGATSDKGRLGIAQKVLRFIGGEKLAEGVGKGLAAPEVQNTLSEEQQQTSELQNKLIERIRTVRELGGDPARLESALEESKRLGTFLADAQQDFVEALPTSKEVIGSSARLAGTLAAGAIGRGAMAATGAKTATGVASGALRGAGAGALAGAAEGGIQGAGAAAEQDKTTEELVVSGLLGAAGGAALGGVIGGVTGGITGGVRGRRVKSENFTEELVAPKMTARVKSEAIRQGRLQDPSLFERATISASKKDKLVAGAVDDVVSPKATIGENIDAIRLKVQQTNTGVRTFIERNNVPFNSTQLRSRLVSGKDDLELIFASDATAEKTYDAVVDAFMKNVTKKNTLGLFEARQGFDQLPPIKKLLESSALGENARKEIVLATRRAANDYVASLLPEGNQYRQLLTQESYMLEALGNISDKAASIIGQNRLQILAAEYPVLKWIVGGIGAGLIGAAGVGVGSTIIGSTD